MDKAEKIKESWRERKTKIKKRWHVPLVFVEWNCERLSYLLEQWAFLDILGHAGRLAILLAVVSYIMGADERRMQAENQRKAKHYQAWQVINAAQGKPGSGGRMDALQDLNVDGISLAGVDISKAWLQNLKLENASLPSANFTEAILFRANFTEADLKQANLSDTTLWDANLTRAYLRRANLTRADLRTAKLTGADLRGANLTRADLKQANLREARCREAKLSGANLTFANLTGADFEQTNLTGADLGSANLTRADLTDANLAEANFGYANLRSIQNWQEIKSIELSNIYGVQNPPDGFIEWAKEHGAVSIKDDKQWQELIRETEKQEEDNSRGDQKKAR